MSFESTFEEDENFGLGVGSGPSGGQQHSLQQQAYGQPGGQQQQSSVPPPPPSQPPPSASGAPPGGPPPAPRPPRHGGVDGVGSSLHFANLHWWTSDAELEALCGKYGTVLGVRFVEERSNGKSKGVATVDFLEADANVRAKEALDGKPIAGRMPAISLASQGRPGVGGPPGGFDGGRGRGRGRGGRGGGRFGDMGPPMGPMGPMGPGFGPMGPMGPMPPWGMPGPMGPPPGFGGPSMM